jgi:hypothetical protein
VLRGKPDKDAGSVAYWVRERPRTQYGAARRLSYSQPRSVAISTAWARSTAPSLP